MKNLEKNYKDKGFFKISPDVSMADKIRKVNLDIPEAISELVANSFDARKSKQASVTVEIGSSSYKGENIVFIGDNAKGMTLTELNNALILGKSTKGKEHKGVYGIGLKTAAGILGDRIVIETRTGDADHVLRVIYDIDEIQKNKQWRVPYETIDYKDSFYFKDRCDETGTAVIISKLRRKNIQFEPIRNFLSLAFKPHIEKEDCIIVAGNKIEPYDYGELFPHTRREISFKIDNVSVDGWIALQKIGQKKIKIGSKSNTQYGISIYRKGQLVLAFYKKFFPRVHPEFGNVIGELTIDPIEVNYTKKGINILSKEWQIVEKRIEKIVKEYAKASVTLHQKTIKGKKISDEEAIINMYKSIGITPRGEKIDSKEVISAEKEITKETVTEEQKLNDKIIKSDLEDEIIKLIGSNEIEIGNQKIKFSFIEDDDTESPWQWHDSFQKKGGNLVITLNKSFSLIEKSVSESERKILYSIALAEELKKELKAYGVQEDVAQREVYTWLNKNYEKIEITLK